MKQVVRGERWRFDWRNGEAVKRRDGFVHLKSDVRAAGDAVEQNMFCRKECGSGRPKGEGRKEEK